MKKITALLAAVLISTWIALKLGYYTSYDDEESTTTFFIKRSATLQMKFDNIFATEGDDKPLERLRPDERAKVIAYCRYRLGMRTALDNQAELDRCKAR